MPEAGWDGYATTWATLHGGFDPRRASPAVRAWLWFAYGAGRLLARVGADPMTVTLIALILNVLVPVVAALGGPWPAALFVVLGAMAGSVDGAVAVLTARTSRLGYLYDSLVQRVAEVCWLAAFWVLGAPVWLLVICGAVAWLHEYVRARAAAVGLTDAGSMTVGERAARLTVTVAGLVLAGVADALLGGMAAGTVTVAAAVWVFVGVFGLTQLHTAIRKSFAP